MSVTLEQVKAVIGKEMPPMTYRYTTRDVSLYALGIGAPLDWLDPKELQFVYELSADGFKVLPSFGVIYTSQMIDDIVAGDIGGIKFNPMMLVHGEQYLEIKSDLPTSGTIISVPRITNIYDKGSGMVIVTTVTSRDENGKEICVGEASMFIRGLGGYGGDRGPSGNINIPPERQPDKIHEEKTLEKQALIYRLSGDINPLHADPAMAAIGNFEKPILHGLCTFGFAVRAVLKHFADNDPSKFKSVRVRFSKHVFPGDTLVTEMWRESETEIIFQTKVKERDVVAISNAKIELKR